MKVLLCVYNGHQRAFNYEDAMGYQPKRKMNRVPRTYKLSPQKKLMVENLLRARLAAL